MLGAHRKGFDWAEIAKVLHMTRAVARASFWREVKRSRSKSFEAQPPATVIQDESDSDTVEAWQAESSALNAAETAFQGDWKEGGAPSDRENSAASVWACRLLTLPIPHLAPTARR